MAPLSRGFRYWINNLRKPVGFHEALTTLTMQRLPPITHSKFRLFPFRSSLLRESHMISVPGLLRYFSSPSFHLDLTAGSLPMTGEELPHSEIPGSKLLCSSPRLIAALYVLRRYLVSRHPLYACKLTYLYTFPLVLTSSL